MADGAATLCSTRAVLAAPPSCVAFSRVAPGLLVLGTYSLDGDAGAADGATQSRSGSLLVYRLGGDGELCVFDPIALLRLTPAAPGCRHAPRTPPCWTCISRPMTRPSCPLL